MCSLTRRSFLLRFYCFFTHPNFIGIQPRPTAIAQDAQALQTMQKFHFEAARYSSLCRLHGGTTSRIRVILESPRQPNNYTGQGTARTSFVFEMSALVCPEMNVTSGRRLNERRFMS
jgi:hypothetical protein